MSCRSSLAAAATASRWEAHGITLQEPLTCDVCHACIFLKCVVLQGLLRGRFLRNGALPVEEERPPSVAARELGQLMQSHRTLTLRLAFLPITNPMVI